MKVRELMEKLMELNQAGKGDKEIKRFNLSEYGQEYLNIDEIEEKEEEVIIY